MTTIFHNADDEHAPFPHRLITTSKGYRFVICAECDHLITREVDGCECTQNCHALQEILENLTVPA